MIKSGNFTIIPVGSMCAVFEEKEDGTFTILGDVGLQPQEASLNKIRRVIATMIETEQRMLDRHTRSWKMYQATKEFMTPDELELAELGWKTFDFEKFKEESSKFSASYEASMIDITDFMLEKNITLKALDSDQDEDIDVVSLESIKNILGNLGKSE